MTTGNNEVEINREALAAEAAALDLGEPPAAAETPAADQPAPTDAPAAAAELSPAEVQAKAEAIEPVIAGVLGALHGVVAPAWEVQPAKMTALAKTSAVALVYWFPHELPPKYVALLMVAASIYGIAQDNRDEKTGAYKPLRETPKPAAADDAVRTAA